MLKTDQKSIEVLKPAIMNLITYIEANEQTLLQPAQVELITLSYMVRGLGSTNKFHQSAGLDSFITE